MDHEAPAFISWLARSRVGTVPRPLTLEAFYVELERDAALTTGQLATPELVRQSATEPA